MNSQIYLNLPVKDLEKSIEFFTKLGFKFNPKFTDENSTCIIVGDDIYVMLLVNKYFKTFTKKEIPETDKNSEVIIAITEDSKERVDFMMDKVNDAGGKEFRETEDYGWLYGRYFEDLDGHQWAFFWMDPSKKES
ncbi:MAG: VOC family protein [Promethearchaeota archaeon]